MIIKNLVSGGTLDLKQFSMRIVKARSRFILGRDLLDVSV